MKTLFEFTGITGVRAIQDAEGVAADNPMDIGFTAILELMIDQTECRNGILMAISENEVLFYKVVNGVPKLIQNFPNETLADCEIIEESQNDLQDPRQLGDDAKADIRKQIQQD